MSGSENILDPARRTAASVPVIVARLRGFLAEARRAGYVTKSLIVTEHELEPLLDAADAQTIPDPLPEHNGIHYCDLPVNAPRNRMNAFDYVRVFPSGELWIGNDEYASQVNFCPWCGKKAKKQI